MFNVGDQVIRIKGVQGHTLDECGIGDVVTVEALKHDGLFDAGTDASYYWLASDFTLYEGDSTGTKPVAEAVEVMRSKLNILKAEPKTKDLVNRVKEVIEDFSQLGEEIAKQLPSLRLFLIEVEAATKTGEFTVEQFKALTKRAQITELEGKYFREDGRTEELTTNARGAVRPPLDTMQPGDTLDITHIDIELRSAPDVPFSSTQVLALLRNGF